MANSISAVKTALAAAAPLGICAQLLLSSAVPAQAQVRFTMLGTPINAALLKANSGAILNAINNQGAIQNNAALAQDIAPLDQNSETATNERIRMAEIAAQREQAQLQAQQAQRDSQAQQTQAWVQLGMGLLGGLLQPRPQAEAPAPQPDLAQLQQLILDQQAQIKALQEQQLPQAAQTSATK